MNGYRYALGMRHLIAMASMDRPDTAVASDYDIGIETLRRYRREFGLKKKPPPKNASEPLPLPNYGRIRLGFIKQSIERAGRGAVGPRRETI